MSECLMENCSRPPAGIRGVCNACYQRLYKAGKLDELAPKPVKESPQVCPPEHKHDASSTCYVLHRCRCQPCRSARATAERRRKRLHAYGRWVDPYVPAEPVRAHILQLQEYGLGWKRIASLSGVGNTALSQLLYGRKGSQADPRRGEVVKRTPREKAAAILAVRADLTTIAPGALVTARGTHRRLQALVARGWSQAKLGRMLGIEPGNFSVLMRSEKVTAARHLQVAELYERMWNEEPPHQEYRDKIAYSRALNHASARGWLAPLAWDDIDTDPERAAGADIAGAEIDEVAVHLAIGGEAVRLTSAERREAVRQLNAAGESDGMIARHLRISDRTVLRIRQELGIAAAVGADGERISA